MFKTVFFDVEDYEREFLNKNNSGNFVLISSPLNDTSKIGDNIADAGIISVFTTSHISEEILEKFPDIKLIALRSVGFNHVDLEYCKKRGITVENSPNYGNKSVAEFAFALMLSVCRKLLPAENDYRNTVINPNNLIGRELGGKTAGVVGAGAIGAAFVRLAYGFDMKILCYDLKPNQELVKKFNVKYVDFETLLKSSDFISLHTPLTKNNFHLFDEKAFKIMKKSAVLVNTARGELVDSEAMFRALASGEIAGAGLDVLESEDTINDLNLVIGINRLSNNELRNTIINSRLFQLPNVIVTPHIAYNTYEAIDRILNTTIGNIRAFEEGHLQNQVN